MASIIDGPHVDVPKEVIRGLQGTCEVCRSRILTEGNEPAILVHKKERGHPRGIYWEIHCPICGAMIEVKVPPLMVIDQTVNKYRKDNPAA